METLFELNVVAQALCALVYAYYLMFSFDAPISSSGRRSRRSPPVVIVLLSFTTLLSTALVVSLCRAGGIWQAPGSNLARSWVVVGWGLCTAQLWAELRWHQAVAGFATLGLAAAIGGVLRLGDLRRGTSVATALPWANHPAGWIHAPSGALGFALMIVAVAYSAAAAMEAWQADQRPERALSILAGGSLISLGAVSLNNTPTSLAILAFAAYGTLTVLSLWLESLDYRWAYARARQDPGFTMPFDARRPRPLLRWGLQSLFGVATIAFLVALVQVGAAESAVFQAWLAFLVTLDFVAFMGVVIVNLRGPIKKRITTSDLGDLQKWSYHAARCAFPLLTIHLVSGSVWAYDAWASDGSGQPRQTWVFISWLYLALILRLSPGKLSTTFVTCASALLVWAVGAALGAGGHGMWP